MSKKLEHMWNLNWEILKKGLDRYILSKENQKDISNLNIYN